MALATRPSARRLGPSRPLSPALMLVAAFTVVGAVIRLIVAHETLFADELSTYWIVTTHSLPDVVSTVHTDAEITPPLYFVLAWATTVFGNTAELLRGPSLIAGVATIPMMYELGRRTVGARAGLIAAGFTVVSPFAINYSAEARSYGIMMALVVGSTLALLLAVDTRRRRWWVVYALCSAGAMYSHYTCAFLLAAQALWVLLRHPEARRPALVANLGAAVLFAPWVTGLQADFNSPTTVILDKLAPFTGRVVRLAFERWAIGYPGAATVTVDRFPGYIALAALVLALGMGAAGALAARRRVSARRVLESRVTLVVLLALSLPVAETVISAVGTNLLGTRNLAASYPALILVMAALVNAAPHRLRAPAVGLAALFFVIGAVKLPMGSYKRPDARAAVGQVERQARPGDVIVDETGILSPGPLTSVDALVPTDRYRILRGATPAERDHPFNVFDKIVSTHDAVVSAVAMADGRPVWLIRTQLPKVRNPNEGERIRARASRIGRVPAPYRLVERRRYNGVLGTLVLRYAPG